MKRSIWSAVLSAALFQALFPALPLTAAEPEDFRYFEELVPPGYDLSGAVELGPAECGRSFGDCVARRPAALLRGRAGTAVQARAGVHFAGAFPVESGPEPGRIVRCGERPGGPRRRGRRAGENGAVLNHVAIRTGEQNFEKRVSISGLDDISWRPLADHLPFFDRNPRFAIGRKEFSIPEGRYRKLRIEIDNYGEDYVSPLRKLTAGDDPAVRREEREVLFRELKIDGVELSRSVFDRVSVSPVLARYTPEIRSVVGRPAAERRP